MDRNARGSSTFPRESIRPPLASNQATKGRNRPLPSKERVRQPRRRPYAVGVVLSRLEMAVTSCAGANGLVRRMLLGTPLEAHSSAAAPVM